MHLICEPYVKGHMFLCIGQVLVTPPDPMFPCRAASLPTVPDLTHMHKHARAHTRKHAHMHAHTRKHTHMHAHTRVYILQAPALLCA